MALQDAVIPVDFGGGVDTKTDPKKVVQGKYLLIENGVFTAIDRVQKRQGYTKVTNVILGGTTLVAPKMVRTYNNELVCQDSGSFYGFSETLNCWIPKGYYQSIDVSNRCFLNSIPAVGNVDVATLNGVSVYAGNFFTSPPAGGNFPIDIYGAAVDQTDENFILKPTVLASNTSIIGKPKAANLGNINLGVTYIKDASNTLVIRTLTSTSSTVAFSGETTVGTSVLAYDTYTSSTGLVVAYLDNTNLHVKTLDTTGATTHSVTVAAPSSTGVHVNVDSANGNVWVYYFDGTNVKYTIYNSTLASIVLAPTTIEAEPSVHNITAVKTSTTTQTAFYSVQTATTGSSFVVVTRSAAVTSAGVVATPSNFLMNAEPVSHCTTVAGRNYALFYHETPTLGTMTGATEVTVNQNTYFLVDLAVPSSTAIAPTVVARLAAQRAYTQYQGELSSAAVLKNLSMVSATEALVGGTLSENDNPNASTYSSAGAFIWKLDWNTNRTFKSEVCGDLLIMNGAMLSAYDGAASAEWGFNLYPEVLTFSTSGSAGLPAGTYSYIAVYEWIDAQGNLHQSETSTPVTLTLGSAKTVHMSYTAANLTQKTNVQIFLYRTTNGGTIYYQVGNGTLSSPYSLSIDLGDDLLDAELIQNKQLYTTGGVLDNTPPAPSMVITPRQNRLWYVDAESTNNTWYTKSFEVGTGLSPTGFLLVEGNPDLGPILGLSQMDDKLVFLKAQGITWLSGDGANDTGTNSSLSPPQNLPSDVGISTGPSVILTPKGIIFQSTKGFYLLDRSLGIHYADQYFNGSAVEQYNTQVVSDARMTAATSQIRFLTQSGVSLVYDYIFDKWGTFTNHLGLAADVWNGSYVYVRTDGLIYKANAASYLDDTTAYALRLQTSWLALGSILGFERVRIAQMVGDYASGASSGHGVQLSFAYDFSTTYSTAVAAAFSASTSGVFQERWFPSQQKCGSISLLIEEITTGTSGEYLDLTNLSFLAGVKKGLNKLPAGNSVG